MVVAPSVRHAPIDRSWPVVGRTFEARRDLLGTLQRLERRYGAVFHLSIPAVTLVMALSAEANELVLRNKDDALSSRRGWARYIDHVFPGAIMGMDGDAHRRQRRIMQAAFQTAALRDYVARMSPLIAARVSTWGGRQRSAYSLLKRLTLDVATDVFVRPGHAPGRGRDALNRAFVDAVAASIALLRVELWPLPFARGVRGAAYLQRHFRSLLPDKRRAPGDDLFSQLVLARAEDGEVFTDDEIIHHLAFLMMAAHDTSTSALTTLVYLLGKHPDHQERLREESYALGDGLPDFAALEAMTSLEHAVHEALRLYPPLPVIPRVVAKPFALHGYSFDPGRLVVVAPLFTHYDERLWTAPRRFDPDRFAPGRAEHQRHRSQWVPFGGGPHRCIGSRFALLEIKAILHQLLRRFRWSLPDRYEMPYQQMPIARPRDGLPLELRPL
ncbi:MAG: cytochrome P450 [Nannocystaceae bacterium]